MSRAHGAPEPAPAQHAAIAPPALGMAYVGCFHGACAHICALSLTVCPWSPIVPNPPWQAGPWLVYWCYDRHTSDWVMSAQVGVTHRCLWHEHLQTYRTVSAVYGSVALLVFLQRAHRVQAWGWGREGLDQGLPQTGSSTTGAQGLRCLYTIPLGLGSVCLPALFPTKIWLQLVVKKTALLQAIKIC